MQKHILKCPNCGAYTMNVLCQKCHAAAMPTKPPKFSLDDKYNEYRRKVKKESLVKKGLL